MAPHFGHGTDRRSKADAMDAMADPASPERSNEPRVKAAGPESPERPQRDVLRHISLDVYVNRARRPHAVAQHVLASDATRRRLEDAEQVCGTRQSSLEHEIPASRKARKHLWLPATQDDSVLLQAAGQRGGHADVDAFFVARVTDPTSYFFRFHYDDHRHLMPQKAEVQLVDLAWLKPHEQVVSRERVDGLRKATLAWDAYTEPLLVDVRTGAILDGHHRYNVGLQLRLKQVPAVLVDYLGDATITVDVWAGCGRTRLTKQEVIDMALSPDVFPPKTSRHRFTESLPPVSIPLSVLRQNPTPIVPPVEPQQAVSSSNQSADAGPSPRPRLLRRQGSFQQISISLICGAQNLATSVTKGLFRNRLRKIEEATATSRAHGSRTQPPESAHPPAAGATSQLDMIRRPMFDASDFFNAIRENDPTSGFCQQKSATFEDLLSSDAARREKFFLTRVCDPTSYFFKYHFDAPPKRQPRKATIHLASIAWLKAHEHVVSWDRVDGLRRATVRWDAYLEPLLVDAKTGAILDGHHRYHVGRQLQLTTVPVVLVDYLGDDSITVDVWPRCGRDTLTKQEVIDMSLSDELFPPKTSRHTFSDDLPPISVPLARLREALAPGDHVREL